MKSAGEHKTERKTVVTPNKNRAYDDRITITNLKTGGRTGERGAKVVTGTDGGTLQPVQRGNTCRCALVCDVAVSQSAAKAAAPAEYCTALCGAFVDVRTQKKESAQVLIEKKHII